MNSSATHTKVHVMPTPQNELSALYELMGIDADSDDVTVMRRMREICEERNSLRISLNLRERDTERLSQLLEQLQHDIISVEQSRAWQLGSKQMGIVKSFLGHAPGRHAFANIHRLLTIYHHWKKSR